jgi:hypothetical protein
MFNDSPAHRAHADRLLEAAIDSAMEMAAAADELDESEAVAATLAVIVQQNPPLEALAMVVAALSIRLRRVSNRGPVPSLE